MDGSLMVSTIKKFQDNAPYENGPAGLLSIMSTPQVNF
jgi:hypothetical protein